MTRANFSPGFRLSGLDVVVLVVGTILSAALWQHVWWMGFIIAFVVGHFFLFCNVVRMARGLELIWAAVFAILAGATIAGETPGWPIAIGSSLAVTAIVVVIELRKPSYHGIAWQQINPKLPEWWDTHMALLATAAQERTSAAHSSGST